MNSTEYVKNAAQNVSHFMSDPVKNIQSINQNTASTIIVVLIVVAVILIVWQYIHIKNLEKKNVSAMNELYGKLNGKITTIQSSKNLSAEGQNNYTYNLRDYYIKTAYNACSGGDYKNDFVSINVLIDLIKQGVRAFDFEIYSIDNQPVVATSTEKSNYVKETYNYVPMSQVLLTLKNYVFSGGMCPNSTDPVILHFRIKSTNQQMYTNFANLLKSLDTHLLGPKYSYEYSGYSPNAVNTTGKPRVNHNLGSIKLLDLCNKIVIIVDNTNPAFLENDAFLEYVNMTSNSPILYLQTNYEIVNTPNMDELTQFNKMNMTIVTPDVGPNPTNPNCLFARAVGCQMVAMRYQHLDTNLEIDNKFFNDSGFAFVLKPAKLRYIPVTIPDPPKPNKKLSYGPVTYADPNGLYKMKA